MQMSCLTFCSYLRHHLMMIITRSLGGHQVMGADMQLIDCIS